MAEDNGSVTKILHRLERSGEAADQEALFERYYSLVLKQARKWTSDLIVADEEDVAESVWQSFFAGAARGQFPHCKDRAALEKLLAKITFRKAVNLRNWLHAAKRYPTDQRSNESIVEDTDLDDLNETCRRIAKLYFVEHLNVAEIARQLHLTSMEVTTCVRHVRGWLRKRKYRAGSILHGQAVDAAPVHEPGPLDQLIAAEILAHLPAKYRQTIALLLQGNRIDQIAERLNVCEETVRRRLRYVRRLWEQAS